MRERERKEEESGRKGGGGIINRAVSGEEGTALFGDTRQQTCTDANDGSRTKTQMGFDCSRSMVKPWLTLINPRVYYVIDCSLVITVT